MLVSVLAFAGIVVTALGTVVVAVVNRNGANTRQALANLREENDRQHSENKSVIMSLQETAHDTNVRIAVIETDLKHVKSRVDRNAEYIDSRR